MILPAAASSILMNAVVMRLASVMMVEMDRASSAIPHLRYELQFCALMIFFFNARQVISLFCNNFTFLKFFTFIKRRIVIESLVYIIV